VEIPPPIEGAVEQQAEEHRKRHPTILIKDQHAQGRERPNQQYPQIPTTIDRNMEEAFSLIVDKHVTNVFDGKG